MAQQGACEAQVVHGVDQEVEFHARRPLTRLGPKHAMEDMMSISNRTAVQADGERCSGPVDASSQ